MCVLAPAFHLIIEFKFRSGQSKLVMLFSLNYIIMTTRVLNPDLSKSVGF